MTSAKPRLLIIGGGSSGLVTLKTALAMLPGWEIVCFEKSGDIIGCWGRPYQGFVSTTSRFATQFASMPEFDASMQRGDESGFKQFFREGEYGEYLGRFATQFDLQQHVRLHHEVTGLTREGDGWSVDVKRSVASDDAPCRSSAGVDQFNKRFDVVVVCTGLVAKPGTLSVDTANTNARIDGNVPTIDQRVRNSKVVVCGGGESAVDTATRLAKPRLGNRVFLSLRSGIRVSPRYHPIRGVPSDYLRNRLMLSIHPDIRNRLGDWFVRARIKFERFRKPTTDRQDQRRRTWAMRLHQSAGEDLFDMFHNKSDGFLDGIAQGRIRIVGPPLDHSWKSFHRFDRRDRAIQLEPDVVVPAIGFQSSIQFLFDGQIDLTQFYHGCVHAHSQNLFAVGFARPVIGNIPTISEMQARWVCGLIAGHVDRPDNLSNRNDADWDAKRSRFTTMADRMPMVYPVEMGPYCDMLAKATDCYPTIKRCGSLRNWMRVQLSPSTTMAYFIESDSIRSRLSETPIYLPKVLIAVLLLLKPFDWGYRIWRRIVSSPSRDASASAN